MTSAGSDNTIVFNGELYNVAEVRAALIARGHVFLGGSDTEVVLYAFDEWGADCLKHLRGMFAIAIWEPRRDRLFLARDRLGIKPLYVAVMHNRLVFASELRTVLASGFVRAALSEAGLASFLALGAVQEPHTIIDGVELLAPGHFAYYGDGNLSAYEYWSLKAAFRKRTGLSDRRAATEALRRKLLETVHQHLVSDRPLGVFLSGGIDSSALVGAVAKVAEPPHSVSVLFADSGYSEKPYIDAVSQHFSTQHTAIELTDEDVRAQVPAAVAAMDQPSVDGVNTFVVSRLARKAGLTVALSGLGADELFGGYDTFRIVPLLNRFRAVPRSWTRVAAKLMEYGGGDSDRKAKLRRWLRAEDDASAYALRRQLFGPAEVRDLMTSGRGAGHIHVPDMLTDKWNSVSNQELSVYMQNTLLRDADVMSMANGLEIRVPFVDHEVVELVAGMPGSWKRRGPTPKPLLVEALKDLLLSEVVERKKMGFTLPYEVWLRGPLNPLMESVLLDENHGGAVGAALNAREVRRVWQRFCLGRTGWTHVWALFVLKCWGERHLASVEAPTERG